MESKQRGRQLRRVLIVNGIPTQHVMEQSEKIFWFIVEDYQADTRSPFSSWDIDSLDLRYAQKPQIQK